MWDLRFFRRHLTIRNILLGALGIGIALRVSGLLWGHVLSDASSYAVMADSFLRQGEFIMPLGEYWSPDWSPTYSHHYSPAYAVFLSPFVALGGLSPWSIKIASFLTSLGMLVVGWWTTKDLYGSRKGLFGVAAVALDPVLISTTGSGFSENLLTMFFVLTIWAILKSLKDGRFIVLAGLFAGLAYLTKGVMGWFFLIAGIAGLVWRFRFIGWRVFRDRYYLTAIAIFGTFVGLWAVRNLARFWDGSVGGLLSSWQSSAYFAMATEQAGSHLGDLAFILVARIPLYMAFFLLIGGLWLKELRRLPKLSDEHYSGLWLAIGLTYLLAWVISAILWVLERNPIYWLDQMRYVAAANLVIIWLVVKDVDPEARVVKRRFGLTLAVLLVTCIVVAAQPAPGVFDAYELLRESAQPGQVVAIDGLLRYEVVVNVGPHLTYVKYEPGVFADYIITANLSAQYPGYSLLGLGRTANSFAGVMPSFDAAVWERVP